MILRQVTPTIWQADEEEARKICTDQAKLLELGIKAVLCPAWNVRIPYAPALASLILPIWDDTRVDDTWFDFAVKFHRSFGPTLVHCHGGLNRSVTFAAALAFSEGQSLEQTYSKLKMEPVFQQMRDAVRYWSKLRKP